MSKKKTKNFPSPLSSYFFFEFFLSSSILFFPFFEECHTFPERERRRRRTEETLFVLLLEKKKALYDCDTKKELWALVVPSRRNTQRANSRIRCGTTTLANHPSDGQNPPSLLLRFRPRPTGRRRQKLV